MVSKSVSSYSKVLLTGDGGDELFAGYDSISFAINLEKYRAIFDNSLGKLTSQVVNRVLQNSKNNLIRKSATF